MASIGAILDFAHDTHPILLKGIVALDDRLQLEASCCVADLLASQQVQTSIDVLLYDLRRDLLDPHEELLV
jgi:hypothetical protein